MRSCTSLDSNNCIHTCKHTQLCPGLSVCLQTLFNCLVCLLQLHGMHGSARFPSDCLGTTHPHHCMSSHTLTHTTDILTDRCTHVSPAVEKANRIFARTFHIHISFCFKVHICFYFPTIFEYFLVSPFLFVFFPLPLLLFSFHMSLFWTSACSV